MKQMRGPWLATVLAAIMLTAACGTEQGTEGAKKDAPIQTGAEPAKQPAKNGARPPGQLSVWPSEKFGRILTDSAGFTLYRFDKDTASPSASTCAGDCATAWPPVPAGATAPAGVDAKLLGSVTRADGAKQLTVAGWPMYRFAKDAQPRDVKGQGVGGVWFAAAPDGSRARLADAGQPAPDVSDSSADEAGQGDEAADQPGLSVRNDSELGPIVVDSRGFTVYRFKKDTAWPMKSACTGDCLKKWPVVAPVAKSNTQGITGKNYLVLKRPDGIEQQTIDCWPVYTFADDTKPGDTKGQGAGGLWYAVSPDGELVGAPK